MIPRRRSLAAFNYWTIFITDIFHSNSFISFSGVDDATTSGTVSRLNRWMGVDEESHAIVANLNDHLQMGVGHFC